MGSRVLVDRTGPRWQHQSTDTYDSQCPSGMPHDDLHALMIAADMEGLESLCLLGILHPMHAGGCLLNHLNDFKTFSSHTKCQTCIDFKLHCMQQLAKTLTNGKRCTIKKLQIDKLETFYVKHLPYSITFIFLCAFLPNIFGSSILLASKCK